MSPHHGIIAVGLMLGCVSGAGAQTAAPPPTATDKVVPEKDQSRPADNPTSAAAPAPTLSDKLTQTNGVIPAPTNVDPGIAKSAPNPNVSPMPIIPPPGSPGGATNAQPK